MADFPGSTTSPGAHAEFSGNSDTGDSARAPSNHVNEGAPVDGGNDPDGYRIREEELSFNDDTQFDNYVPDLSADDPLAAREELPRDDQGRFVSPQQNNPRQDAPRTPENADQARLQRLERLEPLARLLESDPDRARRVFAAALDIQSPEASPQGQGAQGTPAQAATNAPPEPPEPLSVPRPEKPSDYSHEEALVNPSGASARYEEQLVAYNEALAEHNAAWGDYNRQSATYTQEQAKRLQAAQETERSQAALRSQLRQGYQMTDQEIRDFEQTMGSPDSLSMDNMVRYYRFVKGHTQDLERIQQAREAEARRQRLQQPSDLTHVPAAREDSNQRIEDSMMDRMIQMEDHQNIF